MLAASITVLGLVTWLTADWFSTRRIATLPAATLVLAGGIVLGLLQNVPVRADLLRVFSPTGAQLRADLTPDEKSSDLQTVSLYPAATRGDTARLVLATAMFLLGAGLFADRRRIVWLCAALATNGALLALLGIVQRLTWNGQLYWSIPLSHGGEPFGPFVNRNNAGGYLNLCLAGTLGLFVWVTRRDASGPEFRGNLRDRFWLQLAGLSGPKLLTATAAGCIVAGILCSFSRSAALAMLAAATVTLVTLWLATRRLSYLCVFGVDAIAGIGLAAWGGHAAAVQARLETIADQASWQHGRLPHWRDSLAAVGDYFVAGSGLGTYRYAYRPYQTHADARWFYHAENQYLEALVEGGAGGLVLLLTAVAAVAGASVFLVRRQSPVNRVAGTLGLFTVFGQTVSGFFDFGLYLPANMTLMALVCGAVSGRAAALCGRRHPRGTRWLAMPGPRSLPWALVLALAAASTWATAEFARFTVRERVLAATQVPGADAKQVSVAISETDARIARLGDYLHGGDDSAEAQLQLARLWVHRYRLQTLDALRRRELPDKNEADLWEMASIAYLHRVVSTMQQTGDSVALAELRKQAIIQNNLPAAQHCAATARRACPLLPDVHLLLAQCSPIVRPTGSPGTDLDCVVRLTPADATRLFRCGALHFDAGRTAQACVAWRRSLALSSEHEAAIVAMARSRLAPLQFVDDVLPSDAGAQVRIVRRYFGDARGAMWRQLILQRTLAILDRQSDPADLQAYYRGAVLALLGRGAEAGGQYALAVRLRGSETTWRYEYARLLLDQGHLDEARRQARWCTRLAPDQIVYRQLLQEIHRRTLHLERAAITGGRPVL